MGTIGCLGMIVISILASIVLTVLLNVILRQLQPRHPPVVRDANQLWVVPRLRVSLPPTRMLSVSSPTGQRRRPTLRVGPQPPGRADR